MTAVQITGKDGFVVLRVTAVMLFASIIIAMMTPMSPTKLAGTLPRSPGVYEGGPCLACGAGWVSSMTAQASKPEAAVRMVATKIAVSRLASTAVMPPIRAPRAYPASRQNR
jgi:hypothetical protein